MTTSYRRITESVEDLLAKSHYMVAKCRVDGNLTFDGHRKTVEETDNESRCRSLCRRIERALESCREEEISGLLEMYDLLHRIGYATQPSQSRMGVAASHGLTVAAPSQRFMAHQRNRVYMAWRAGNRNIQESQIYPILKKSVNGRPFANKMLKNWVRTLVTHNHFPNVTAHENYQRLALVMRENIDALIQDWNIISGISYGKNAKELKREWYKANNVDDFTTLSTPLLKYYRAFSASLFPALFTKEAQQDLEVVILSELFSRPDLNLYDRKALEEVRPNACL